MKEEVKQNDMGESFLESDSIRFRVSTTDDTKQVFLAGNFNDWDEKDTRYKLTSLGAGKFELDVPASVFKERPIEYRYHRGNWLNVELDEFGNLPIRRVLSDLSKPIFDTVPKWKINGLAYNPKFLPKIELISDHFVIPELDKTRRISALLPYNYEESNKSYPVLYLQDGQNLADEDAPFGNWAVDKKLAILNEMGYGDIIVIAIDHGGKDRIKEFQPYNVKSWQESDGKRYADFIVNTLKPYVDKNYRTNPDRKFNGIGGSSMGGLISIYAGLMFPDIFSKMMIFSPSLWASPKIYQQALDFGHQDGTKVYLYGGAKESKGMIPDITRFKNWLLKNQKAGKKPVVHLKVNENGEHNERYWGYEFPGALKWLFSEN